MLEELHNQWKEEIESFVQFYQIGPFKIQICSNDLFFAQNFTRAFSHLISFPAPHDLAIRLWIHPKLPPLDWDLIQKHGYRGSVNHPLYFHYFETIGALSIVDVETNIAYYAIRDVKTLPWWVYGSPLQAIFHVWMREKNIQLAHSASIAYKESSLLLVGKGGSGKSTTVLSCLQEEFQTLGEDYLLLDTNQIYSIYQSAKWRPQTRSLFPFYESHIVNPKEADQEKALVYYEDLFPKKMVHASSPQAIVSLQVGSFALLQKATLSVSLQGLLLTTLMQLPHPDSKSAEILHGFAKELEHYRLHLGPNVQENTALLRSLFL